MLNFLRDIKVALGKGLLRYLKTREKGQITYTEKSCKKVYKKIVVRTKGMITETVELQDSNQNSLLY